MVKSLKQTTTLESNLYYNILLLSRNKLFYTEFGLADTFQNRIYLIFLHVSFLFIKIKHDDNNKQYKILYQRMFDLMFNKIELNMREIGFGDVMINKNMKFLVKTFYHILLNCENFKAKSLNSKNIFLLKYLDQDSNQKEANNVPLIQYFDKYQTFCFDLSSDSVLKGELKFNYK